MDDSTDLGAMAHMTNELDDLGNLFEFGDIDLNNIPDPGEYGDHMQQQQHGTHPSTPFQDLSEAPHMPGTSAQDFVSHEQFGMSQGMDQQRYMRQTDNHAPTSNPYSSEALYQPSIQHSYHPHQQNYQFHPQQSFPPAQHVPPTPNSYEMHGETGRFMQRHPQMDPQQRALMEQRYHVRKDDAIAFTPMVSPAGTPQYNIPPEFTTPGAYFSPLTSPMLHAQNQQQQAHLQQQTQQQQGYLTNPSTAPSSHTNSPIDPNADLDMIADGMRLPDSAGLQPRKSRRKITTPRGLSAGSRGSQSQPQRVQKRKSTTSSANVPTTNGDTMSQRTLRSQPSSTGRHMSQFDSSGSGTESISPEPLSESLMGPPPRPGSSLNQSPALAGQQQNGGATAVGAAATPKSLLTMRGSQQSINDQQGSMDMQDTGGLDDFSLPEAVSFPDATTKHSRRPSLTQINTQMSPSDDNTPRLSARKTPKLGPLSTPASARASSALASPSVIGSPLVGSTPGIILKDKKDAKGGRSKQKRGSMSANGSKMVSPALVPKISPSIKPLLPEGTPLNSATQAMLLASKSNYQNILEGNHLPGVSYPDSLSTGLTSKRTSHKVAEQGRRNRINEALKEMQFLVPKSARSPNGEGEGSGSPEVDDDKAADSKENKEDAAVKSNSSKAATVELANEYIKRMQKVTAAQDSDIAKLRRENEALRKRLGEQSGSSPESSRGRTSSPASVKV